MCSSSTFLTLCRKNSLMKPMMTEQWKPQCELSHQIFDIECASKPVQAQCCLLFHYLMFMH